MPYYYDTHAHTSETSRCSHVDGASLAHAYKNAGFDGFFVTDHFFNANTTVPRTGMEWADRVAMFMRGWENAKAEGDRIGVDVFFGWEYTVAGCDFLTYNLGADWLLRHPDVCEWKPNDYFDHVHADGGFVVHAHPFREENYIESIRLYPHKVDAVETYNACRDKNVNEMAALYAKFYGLPQTSGTDLHRGDQENYGGVVCDEKFACPQDYCRAVAERRAGIIEIIHRVKR